MEEVYECAHDPMKALRPQTEHLLNSEESNAPALLKHANVGIILSIRMLRTTLHAAFNASYFSHSDICITLPMQFPALWFYGGIGCGPNWRSTKRWSHCWGSSRWWRNATRRWNSCVAEQAGYITSSTRSEGISVPTWLRSGLKFRVQTIPHPANLPLQKLSDSDRSSIYTSTWEGAGAACRPVSMASG